MKFKFLDIVQLNGLLRDDQSVVRIKLSPDNEYAGIVLVSEKYLDSYILNPSDELIDAIEAFFIQRTSTLLGIIPVVHFG